MKKSVETTFKKLLGRGRAFLTPKGFSEEFLDILISPFSEIKERIISLKFTHFPTKNLNTDDIKNGEEMFALTDIEGKTLIERAQNVEGQWSVFGGCQNYKQIERILQRKGFPVVVIENIPRDSGLTGTLIGNGKINTPSGKLDPINISSKKYSFIVQETETISNDRLDSLIKEIVKIKPAQNAVYFVRKYLRKKEIHHVLTKTQMQAIKKSQYCNVKTN